MRVVNASPLIHLARVSLLELTFSTSTWCAPNEIAALIAPWLFKIAT